jgi:hypothetical protein
MVLREVPVISSIRGTILLRKPSSFHYLLLIGMELECLIGGYRILVSRGLTCPALVLVRAIEPSTPLHFSQSVNAAVQPVMSDSNRLSLFFQVTLGEVLPR